ncbi:hypothetical protein TWF788_004844 [Orbilia oligospora]|uniref:PhoD-like phosphatase domain-containing protein n=1 Tax=Orbilia oligospora TaxID=2813651 RepID=A0A6G1MCJ7_ORBOL|nr:hypothetical protein TWF788_004844 [Orbilia oligospora]KAF3206442.1 hypothetical protein TWF679_008746 [Orbilia oligospora]KAF3253999.1 hypothetical protein TWF192_003514 [Orbilia oligospora]
MDPESSLNPSPPRKQRQLHHIRIPQRDASIGGASLSSPSTSPRTNSHSHSQHRRQLSSATATVTASASATENSPPALRVRKGKGRVETGSEPTSPAVAAAAAAYREATAAKQQQQRSPSAKHQPNIEPRRSSLNASKPVFTSFLALDCILLSKADDRGPLQKLQLELQRIGKEEGLIGPESTSNGTGVTRTLSRKQAQRLLRSTEVPSKQTAIAHPDSPTGTEASPPSAFKPSHVGRSASLSTPSQASESKRRYSASFAERARQEQEQGTVRKHREPIGFAVMDTLPPPPTGRSGGTRTPVSARSINGRSINGEPSRIEPKVVDRHKGRFHLHHHKKEGELPLPHREGLYLDVGEEPQWPSNCAHVCLSDLELVDEGPDVPAVPISSGFVPPLKIRCGPLLRYTGLRQEDGLEIWRGSILIVTKDDESTYEPIPHIRLFGQGGEIPNPTAPADEVTEIPAINAVGETQQVRRASTISSVSAFSASDLNRDGGDELPASLRYNFGPAKNPPKRGGTDRFRKDGERQGKAKDYPAEKIHAEKGTTFWRFNLEIELGAEEQRIAYRINNGGLLAFYVPAANQTMNIMFHSCNGFSMAVDPNKFCGPDPLWRDVLRNHYKRPFHVMLGGGDQLYNDCVSVQSPKFKAWLAIKDQHVKDNTPFDHEFQEELETFYLNRYCLWFSQGLYGVATTTIPSANCYDDHDIIDGFGSYPEAFNGCPVFAGLGTVAFKYYMLFQHHTTVSEGEPIEPSWVLGAQPGPYIREPSRSTFMFLGRRVAFMALDCRTERTRDLLLTNETYTRIFQRLEQEIIQGQTKHLIILLGVPIAYPRLVWLENILTSSLMDPIKYIASKRTDGTLNGFLNKFDGGVELLDDMMDHWTARGHKRERNWLILELQKLAAAKDCRVTFLGGDVHLGTFGHFISRSGLKIPKVNDFRYMVNVVSSAIVNTPPPNALADLLNKRNKIHKLQRDTHEEQIKIFFTDPKGKKRNNNTTLPARNYCRISENQTGSHVGEYTDITKPVEAEKETDIDFRGGLDLVINFEVDQTDPHGHTKAYGFTTPVLQRREA